jgi:hypothetical protein
MSDERVARDPRNGAYVEQHQADYLLRQLDQIYRRIDNRIDRYLRMSAIFEACGDVDYARTFRRLRSLEEQDRQILSELMDNLRRRFPPRARG